MNYRPSDWYWTIPGLSNEVFSSKAADLVSLTDADYTAWLASGNLPSMIGANAGLSTEEAFGELYDVLKQQAPTVAASVSAAWMAAGYLNREQEFDYLNTIGVVVTSTAKPTLSGTYAIDATSQARIQGIALYMQVHSAFPNGSDTLSYPDMAGVPHVFSNTADFLNFATAVGDYFTALVTAELDGSAWPNNHKTIA